MKRLALLALAAVSLVFLTGAPVAYAAATSSGQGSGQALEIAPPLITLKVDPGQTVKTKIQLRNITKNDLLVTNQINDFVANGEDGTPKILTGNDKNNPFTMKSWVTPLQVFTLTPQHTKDIPVIIHVPKSASPGGHYGVIRFTGTPPQLKGQGVSLSASLGALVLLTVSGKLTDDLSVSQFATTPAPPKPDPSNPKTINPQMKPTSLFESAPLQFLIKLKNNGNVQEQPVGHIVITNMFGKAVAGVNVNLGKRNVLPASTRQFTALLNKNNLGDKRLFGRYHAVITVKYGVNSQKEVKASLTFWVIPWKLIIGIVIALIVLFFVLRHLLRRYKRRVISQVNGGATTQKPKKPTKKQAKKSTKKSKK